MAGDVWSAGADVGLNEEGGVHLGEPSYDDGVPVNLALRVDTVVKNGFMLLTEQPMLVLLGGLNVWLVSMIPAMLKLVLDVGTIAAQVGSGGQQEPWMEFVPQIVQLITQMALFPVQQVVLAGALVAVAAYIRTEQTLYRALYTSFGAAVRALLYSLLVGAISSLLAAIGYGAAAGAGFGLYMATNSIAGGIVIGGVLGLAATIGLIYVGLGLQLGIYAAVLDDQWPVEALVTSWRAADGARFTLLITGFVIALMTFIATCMLWFPAIFVQAFALAGMTAGWMLYARPLADTAKLPFFERNPTRLG